MILISPSDSLEMCLTYFHCSLSHGHTCKLGEQFWTPFLSSFFNEPAAYWLAAALTPVGMPCPPMSTWTSKSTLHTMTVWVLKHIVRFTEFHFMESRIYPHVFTHKQWMLHGIVHDNISFICASAVQRCMVSCTPSTCMLFGSLAILIYQ